MCVIATELGDMHGLVAAVGVSTSSSRVAYGPGADTSLVGVNSLSRFLVSDWAKADPVGWMLPPADVVLQAGRWPAIEKRVRPIGRPPTADATL